MAFSIQPVLADLLAVAGRDNPNVTTLQLLSRFWVVN